MSVGLIILAAGSSTRLGKPKQLVQFRGRSLLQYAVITGLASRLRPVVAVISDLAHASEAVGADVVMNLSWREGMGTSIRAGLEKCLSTDGVVIWLCDQPLVTAEFLNRLAATKNELAAAEYDGTIGVPAYFSAEYFCELKNLRAGAKEILMRHRAQVEAISCSEAAMDVDTAEDVLRLAQEQQSQQ